MGGKVRIACYFDDLWINSYIAAFSTTIQKKSESLWLLHTQEALTEHYNLILSFAKK